MPEWQLGTFLDNFLKPIPYATVFRSGISPYPFLPHFMTEVDPEFWTGGEVRVPLLN